MVCGVSSYGHVCVFVDSQTFGVRPVNSSRGQLLSNALLTERAFGWWDRDRFVAVRIWMIGCWGSYMLATSRSNQDKYRLVTVCTYGNFIVLPHWGNQASGTMTCYPTQPQISWNWANHSLPYPIDAEYHAKKHVIVCQWHYMSLFWLDQKRIPGLPHARPAPGMYMDVYIIYVHPKGRWYIYIYIVIEDLCIG